MATWQDPGAKPRADQRAGRPVSNPRAFNTTPRALAGEPAPPLCPVCDRLNYSPAEPCPFCAGMCGGRTKKGTGCRWQPRDECPVAKHSVYRTYTETALREETDYYVSKTRDEAGRHAQRILSATPPPAVRRTFTDMGLPLTPPERYL